MGSSCKEEQIGLNAVAWMRAHQDAVTAVEFGPGGLTLVSGDEKGWVVWWDILVRRPKAIWKAHSESVLGLSVLDSHLVSQGRDNKLKIWTLEKDHTYNCTPLTPCCNEGQYPAPWLAYTQQVSSISFCKFAALQCETGALVAAPLEEDLVQIIEICQGSIHITKTLDIAHDKKIEVALTPDIGDIEKLGMLMALCLFQVQNNTVLSAGFENGSVAIMGVESGLALAYSKPHKQPVLSLDVLSLTPQPAVISGCAGKSLAIFRADGAQPELIKTPARGNSVKTSLKLKMAVTASFDGCLRLWSTETTLDLLATHSLSVQCQGLNCAAIAPVVSDNKKRLTPPPPWLVVCGAKDGRVVVFQP